MSYLIRNGNNRNNITYGGGINVEANYLKRTSTGRNDIAYENINDNVTRKVLERTGTTKNNIKWSDVDFSFVNPYIEELIDILLNSKICSTFLFNSAYYSQTPSGSSTYWSRSERSAITRPSKDTLVCARSGGGTLGGYGPNALKVMQIADYDTTLKNRLNELATYGNYFVTINDTRYAFIPGRLGTTGWPIPPGTYNAAWWNGSFPATLKFSMDDYIYPEVTELVNMLINSSVSVSFGKKWSGGYTNNITVSDHTTFKKTYDDTIQIQSTGGITENTGSVADFAVYFGPSNYGTGFTSEERVKIRNILGSNSIRMIVNGRKYSIDRTTTSVVRTIHTGTDYSDKNYQWNGSFPVTIQFQKIHS